MQGNDRVFNNPFAWLVVTSESILLFSSQSHCKHTALLAEFWRLMQSSIYSEGASGACRMGELCIDGTSCQACDFELCCVSARLRCQSWSHAGDRTVAPSRGLHRCRGALRPPARRPGPRCSSTWYALRLGSSVAWRNIYQQTMDPQFGCDSGAARIKSSFAPVGPQISRACLEPLFDGKGVLQSYRA